MKKKYTLTLDPEIVKRAKIQAICEDTNLSALIEKLLVEYLNTCERKEKTTNER